MAKCGSARALRNISCAVRDVTNPLMAGAYTCVRKPACPRGQ